MSRLIDAEKLDLVSYQGIPNGYKDSFDSGVLYAMNLMDDQPTIDAAPVVHGHWIGKPLAGYSTVKCSACGSAFMENNGKWKYCPDCGAKMDEVTE